MFRILLVDDNPADAALLRVLFDTHHRSIQLDCVEDGSQALDFLHQRGAFANALRPSLVLMDLNMPRIGGLQVLATMKSDPEFRAIPVIMLSTFALPAEVRRMYQSYANCYVQKPDTLKRSVHLVRAIEAFWMDEAVFPPSDDSGTSGTVRPTFDF